MPRPHDAATQRFVPRRGVLLSALAAALLAWTAPAAWATAAAPQTSGTAAAAAPQSQAQPPAQAMPGFYIREYRVLGAHHLKPDEIQNAVYPYLGPGRTAQDVDHARAALQKVYEDKQYTSVNVEVPPQTGAGGVVLLQVNELTVGRLRVHGAKYFDIDNIKRLAPSLAEGQLINFTDAQRDLVRLNQLPDRRVTPVIRAGVIPGTMDVDLDVKDSLPLHGSLEFNNRYSVDTPDERVDASLSYDNLWQLGHSFGGSVQTSPEDTNKVAVFTAFYTVRLPTVDWLSFTIQGSRQDTSVATLGSLDSVGRGEVFGLRTSFKLPTLGDYFESFTVGLDYKNLNQNIEVSPGQPLLTGSGATTYTTYVPITLDYSGTWVGKNFLTALDLSVVFNIRGIGSNALEFDNNRFGSDRNFIYLRGSLSDTQDIKYGAQLFAKISGQVSDSPLVNSEEYSVGGLDTVRGYLESEVLGDDAAVFNFEARTPSLLAWFPKLNTGTNKDANEWRFYFFMDAATVGIQDALPGTAVRESLASYGGGTHITLFDHLNGSVDLAIPLFSQTVTSAHHPFLTFRVWTDF